MGSYDEDTHNASVPVENCTREIEEERGSHTPYVMVFLFGGLAVGLSLQALTSSHFVTRFVRIPFTVTLLILGLILGVIIETTCTDIEAFRIYSTYTMVETHPKLILYIFIPILIFDSSFRLEAHSVYKAKGQIMLMATAGLLISTFAIAGGTYLLVNVAQGVEDWHFSVSLVFGSILSATDPVAVVALLRELGAPRQVVILTEGESLFNDGAAIIAYSIFSIFSRRDLMYDQDKSVIGQILGQVVSMIVSPIVGFVSGKVCEILLKRTFNDEIREKGIILIAVYETFFVAEMLHASGVVALVVLGVWLGYKKYSISFETIEDNSKFWDFFSNWANILIFILAGMVIAKPLVRNVSHDGSIADYGYLVVIYIIINLARALSLFLLFPALKRMGYGFSLSYALTLTWGGLRGAIALILALEFLETEPIHSCFRKTLGDKVVLYTCGCVALTLLINATTYGSLLRILRLDAVDVHKIRLMRKVMTHLKLVQAETLCALKEDRFLAEADWDMVETLTQIRNPYEHWELKDYGPKKTGVIHSEAEAQREEARLRLLHVERVSYWRQFGKGLLSHRSINCLLDVVDELAERPGSQVTVQELRKGWDIPGFWTKIQQIVSYSNDAHTNYHRSMHTRKPENPVRMAIYDVLFSRTWDVLVILLIITDVILFLLEMVGTLSAPFDQLDLALFTIYGIFLTEFALKLVAIGRNYFRSKRNLFDIAFVFLYIACIACIVANARSHAPSVYVSFEALSCLRLCRVYFLLPVILPNVLEFVNWKINEQVGLSYDTAKGFIVGEEDAYKSIRRLVENPKEADELRTLCQRRRLDAIRYLAELQARMPGCTTSVKTKQAAQFCLNGLQDALEEMKEGGLVDEKEYEDLAEAIQEKILGIARAPPWMRSVRFERQVTHMNWLNKNPELMTAILDSSIEIDYMEGEIIYRQGNKSDGLYIISSGMVRVVINSDYSAATDATDYIHAGRYFGEMSTITGEPRSTTMVADVKTTVYHIPTEKLMQIIGRHKTLYWQFIISYCIQKCCSALQSLTPFDSWSDAKLKDHLTRGDLIDLSAGTKYQRRDDEEILVLVRGDVKCHNRRFHAHSNCVLLPQDIVMVQRDPGGLPAGLKAVWLFAVPPANPTVRRWFSSDSERRGSTPHHQNGAVPAAARRMSLSMTTNFDGVRPQGPVVEEFQSDGAIRLFASQNYGRNRVKRSSIDL